MSKPGRTWLEPIRRELSGWIDAHSRPDFSYLRLQLAPGQTGLSGPPASTRTGISGLSRAPGPISHRDFRTFSAPWPPLAPGLTGLSWPPASTCTETGWSFSGAPGRHSHRDFETFSGPRPPLAPGCLDFLRALGLNSHRDFGTYLGPRPQPDRRANRSVPLLLNTFPRTHPDSLRSSQPFRFVKPSFQA